MWKRIVIYIIILIILLGLYFFFTPQSLKVVSEKSLPQFQEEDQNESSGFKEPIGAPSAKGPGSPPPQQQNLKF